jgi:RNA polymerase sigma-70 factor, ECF subfamily
MDGDEQAALVMRCKQTLPDDPRAFETLIAAYKERVFATAYRIMGNRHDAEDAAQEVFLKVYRGIKTLDNPYTLTSWIYKITTNTCLDQLQSRRRRPWASIRPRGDEAEQEEEWETLPSEGGTPEDAALRAELIRCLQSTLVELDAPSRAAIVLRDVEGRPYGEVAEAMALGLSAVKMRIHRARIAFRSLLDKICPDVWQGGTTVET